MKPLAIIPLYLAQPQDVEVVHDCIKSLRKTEPDGCDLLIVDDGSPKQELVTAIESKKSELSFDLVRKENGGFSSAVNVGLRKCLHEGRDAILVNADLEFIDRGWLDVFISTEFNGDKASVVGALLLYPSGLIQHGGIYFSLLHRCFEHIYKFAPADLPEAQSWHRGPVTGALQYIRHECLDDVGVYDEGFRLGYEDVDYCIRAHNAEKLVVYNPRVRAYHFESMFRSRPDDKLKHWQDESWAYFLKKHAKQSFSEFVPSIV